MKKLIKFVSLILAVFMMSVIFTACGSSGPDISGKYLMTASTAVVDGSDASEYNAGSYVILEKGGKGKFCGGGGETEFDLEWKLNGENFEGKVTFLGMENEMNGTYKDGVLSVVYGDFNFTFEAESKE